MYFFVSFHFVTYFCVWGIIIVSNFFLKGRCIEFKYYADGIHSGLTPPG